MEYAPNQKNIYKILFFIFVPILLLALSVSFYINIRDFDTTTFVGTVQDKVGEYCTRYSIASSQFPCNTLPSTDLTVTDQNTDDNVDDNLMNNIEAVAKQSYGVLFANCTSSTYPVCIVNYGNSGSVTFLRSYTQDNTNYYVYAVTILEVNGYREEHPTQYFEINDTTKVITDVTEREQKLYEADQAAMKVKNMKAINAVISYLQIKGNGEYHDAGQIPANYTFDNGAYIELWAESQDSTATYLFYEESANSPARFFKVNIENGDLQEISSDALPVQ